MDHAPSRQRPPDRPNVRLVAVCLGLAAAAGFFFVEGPSRSARGPAAEAGGRGRRGDAAGFASYAGSASCRDCHADEFDHWNNSHHAQAERALELARDRRAFDPPREIRHGTQTSEVDLATGATFAPALTTVGPGGVRRVFPLARVIGVDPLRQFLVALPGGRFQVTELAFDPRRQEWFDVFGNEDRRAGEWGHWTGRGMTWNAMCAACHN
ncbi:MAG: cytochrome c family protein, partial [Verrucomicrobia bacterium]|nr:cytochrome c family protein [Verrucomicrobiota bacterium]